jgi:hypothetical protein
MAMQAHGPGFALIVGTLAGCAALVACHDERRSNSLVDGERKTPESGKYLNALDLGIPDVLQLSGTDKRDIDKYFPISKYQYAPVNVRRLLQRADFEHDYCRNAPRPDDQSEALVELRCNASDRVMAVLEDEDWCWGGGWVAADDHWLKCSEEPGNSDQAGSPPLTHPATLTPQAPQAR